MIKFDVLKRERLADLFCYDPESGIFRYRTHAARRVRPGDIAGSVNNQGYRHIRVDGRAYKAHRLAWFYVTGAWPSNLIDHINGDRDDNRFSNLREATRSQNLANSKVFRAGKNQHKGARPYKGRWRASISHLNQRFFLGDFATEGEAISAYSDAARSLFGNFARVQS